MLPMADAVERYAGTDASKIEMECREGQILIFKFTANTQLCTSAATAEMWEQMGVGQIVRSPIDGNSMDQSTTPMETTTDILDTENHEVISPDQQVENGITKEDVICKSELTLMIRSSGSPACVQMDSIKELESRGWIVIEQTHEDVKQEEEPKSSNDISVELEESVGIASK